MLSISQRVTRNIIDSYVPQKVMYHYNEIEKNQNKKTDWKNKTELEIWNELCFCILSGNVLYDLAKSVIEILNKKELLNPYWINETDNALSIIQLVLETPNFEPRKKNGELRKYRYPKKRAKQIVAAAQILYSNNNSIKNILHASNSDIDVRNFFAEQIPGLGIKESSHFLRNIGYSDSLAIIDVHMLSFLHSYAFLEIRKGIHLTTKMYLRIENLLRNFVKYHGLNLAIFDLAVWHHMRNLI